MVFNLQFSFHELKTENPTKAYLTAKSELFLDEKDPFPRGFRVGDIWAWLLFLCKNK